MHLPGLEHGQEEEAQKQKLRGHDPSGRQRQGRECGRPGGTRAGRAVGGTPLGAPLLVLSGVCGLFRARRAARHALPLAAPALREAPPAHRPASLPGPRRGSPAPTGGPGLLPFLASSSLAAPTEQHLHLGWRGRPRRRHLRAAHQARRGGSGRGAPSPRGGHPLRTRRRTPGSGAPGQEGCAGSLTIGEARRGSAGRPTGPRARLGFSRQEWWWWWGGVARGRGRKGTPANRAAASLGFLAAAVAAAAPGVGAACESPGACSVWLTPREATRVDSY